MSTPHSKTEMLQARDDVEMLRGDLVMPDAVQEDEDHGELQPQPDTALVVLVTDAAREMVPPGDAVVVTGMMDNTVVLPRQK